MSISTPAIDILLATYNGQYYIGQQIESIISQTYEHWRLYISDDCSTDDTVEIVRLYAKADPRIRLIPNPSKRGSAKNNFLHLLRHSSAPYTMFCDQDDVWHRDKVSLTLEKMVSSEGTSGTDCPIVVFTDSVVVDEYLNTMSNSFMRYAGLDPHRTRFEHMVVSNTASGNTMMLNQALVKMLRHLKPTDIIFMHDWYAMLTASAFGRIEYIPKATLLYRQHQDNSVGARKYSAISHVLSRFDAFSAQLKMTRLSEEVDTAMQAVTFIELNEEQLTPYQIRCIKEYVLAIVDTSFLSACIHLLRSRCWKSTCRQRLGQIVHRYEYVNALREDSCSDEGH